MDIRLYLKVLLSIPKSLYFCIHYWGFKVAMRLPVLVSYNTCLKRLDGTIQLGRITPGIVKIGFTGSFGLGGGSYIDIAGNVLFKGKASFAKGAQIIVGKDATLSFGDNFRCNSNCLINAGKNISFGDDNLFAWNVTVLDGDGHSILDMTTGIRTNHNREIFTGSHVWICPEVSLLKGSNIPDNCVVASRSVITAKILEENTIIGNCNKIIKHSITWSE